LECDLQIYNKHVEQVLAAFSLRKSDPLLISSFNKVYCLSCDLTGGVFFSLEDGEDFAECDICSHKLQVDSIIDMKANALRTVLLEKSYNYKFFPL